MSEHETINKIRKEIERRRDAYLGTATSCIGTCCVDGLEEALEIIESTPEEPETPMEILASKCPQENIDPEIAQCIADHWWEMAGEEKEPPELEEEIQKYMDEHVYEEGEDEPLINSVARHFYQFGAEHAKKDEAPVPNDLEEAAKKHSCYDEDCEGAWYEPIVRNAFIAGAKWMEEHMMNI